MIIDFSRIEQELIDDSIKILENMGLDITTAFKMMLKKISNEKNISFLLSNNIFAHTSSSNNISNNNSPNNTADIKMTKSKATNLFLSEGITLKGITTFSSKNKSAYTYWANPEFKVLETQWNLILNDWAKRELHLFSIPANSISTHSMVCRNDKEYQIDIQIMYDDKTFTDNRSKISFSKFHIKTIKY